MMKGEQRIVFFWKDYSMFTIHPQRESFLPVKAEEAA